MKTDIIVAQATLTRPAPRGYKGQIIVTAKLYQLGGNARPYFSVTGEISTPCERAKGDAQTCGCIHEHILKAFPRLAPLVALHLADDGGAPMHAEANGFYQLAGCVYHHFGERYHGGNSERHFPITPDPATPWRNAEYRFPTEDECLTSTAEYLRTTQEHISIVLRDCLAAYERGKATVASSEPATEAARANAGNMAAKAEFSKFIEAQRTRWQDEAAKGLELIRSLSVEPVAA